VAVPPEHDGLRPGSTIYATRYLIAIDSGLRYARWAGRTAPWSMVALAWSSTAFAETHEPHRGQRQSQRDATAVSPATIQLAIERPAKGFPLLRCDGIRWKRLSHPACLVWLRRV